jgi:hypothetical protein
VRIERRRQHQSELAELDGAARLILQQWAAKHLPFSIFPGRRVEVMRACTMITDSHYALVSKR